MQELTTAPAPVATVPDRMSSLEIAELTNKQHGHVLRDIREMAGTLALSKIGYCIDAGSYVAANGQQYELLSLDRDTCICLLTGYDVAARMRVIQRWQALEASKAPQSAAELILMLAQQNVATEQRMSALEQGHAEIKAQLTTRNEDYYTIAGFAALHRKQVPMKLAATLGRKASKLSKDNDLPISTTYDPRFGTVNTYHKAVLEQLLLP